MACRVIVLGAGLVGGPMAADLAHDPRLQVSLADRDPQALARTAGLGAIAPIQRDLGDPAAVRDLVRGFDLVVGAMPGWLGFQTLQACLEAGRNVVDISFFSEDPFMLDDLARSGGATAVVDCGVFPGLGSVLVGDAARRLGQVDSVLVLVGGLPVIRRLPFEYKAVFSPLDVIEEYTRAARFLEKGTLVTRPALSDPELVDIPGIGTLEAFNTDGLRTLLTTIDAPDMKEKTLRYPGHAARMEFLRDCGFFRTERVSVPGGTVRPVDVTAALLFPQWRLEPTEADLTVLRVEVQGQSGRRRVRWVCDLVDRYDPAAQVTSMARTTGYTAAVVARMVAEGIYREPGISPPEFLGRRPEWVQTLTRELARRRVTFTWRELPEG